MDMTFKNETSLSLVQYFPEVTCLCSITKVPFFSKLEVEFVPERKLLEFIAFDEWLKSLADKDFTIESLCQAVFDKLSDELGMINLSVTVHANTIVHSPAVANKSRTVNKKYKDIVQVNLPKEIIK